MGANVISVDDFILSFFVRVVVVCCQRKLKKLFFCCCNGKKMRSCVMSMCVCVSCLLLVINKKGDGGW